MGRRADPNRKTRADYDYKLVRVHKPNGQLSTVSLQHWDYVKLLTVSRLPPEGFNRYIRQVASGIPFEQGHGWSKAVVQELRQRIEAGQAADPLP